MSAGYRPLPSKSSDISAQARRNAAFMGFRVKTYTGAGPMHGSTMKRGSALRRGGAAQKSFGKDGKFR